MIGAAFSAVVAIAAPAADSALPAVDAERTLANFADCIVARPQTAGLVRSYLRMSPNDPAAAQVGVRLSVSECMPRSALSQQLSFKSPSLRGALFAALYRRAYAAKAMPANLGGVASIAVDREFLPTVTPLPEELRYARTLGDCVVRFEPGQAHMLMFARIGSPAEKAALNALVPPVRACLPKGGTIKLNRAALRSLVAEGLYKLRSTAPVTARVN